MPVSRCVAVLSLPACRAGSSAWLGAQVGEGAAAATQL